MVEQGPEDDPTVLHVPVMAGAVAERLAPALDRPDAVYVDGTLGMAGHACLILDRCPQAVLVGIDQDAEALDVAGRRLARFGSRVRLVQARFDDLGRILDDAGVTHLDAMLLDLGLSSLQIDRAARGFAYRVDAPLDMRMDTRGTLTAADVLNTYPPAELVRILREYGEERQAQRIVRAIVAERGHAPFTTSARLVQTIISALPAAVRGRQSGHPARRVFQALRIEVNGELDALAGVLPVMLERMNQHARAAVLAYHSLEDRIVKRAFAEAASDLAPAGLPVVPEHLLARFTLLTRGAQRPTAEEIAKNPRAASARLRVIERVRPSTGEAR